MIEEISKEIIGLLMSERGLSMEDYSQSTAYVYEYLDKELSTGKMS